MEELKDRVKKALRPTPQLDQDEDERAERERLAKLGWTREQIDDYISSKIVPATETDGSY